MNKTPSHSNLNSSDKKPRGIESKQAMIIRVVGVILLFLVFMGLFLTLSQRPKHPLTAPTAPPLVPPMSKSALPSVDRSPEAIRQDVQQALNKFNYQIRTSPYFMAEDHLPIPKVRLVDIKGNVAFLRLQHSDVVVRQMGSHGAADYFERLRHTLAGIEGLSGFNIPTETGDHLDD